MYMLHILQINMFASLKSNVFHIILRPFKQTCSNCITKINEYEHNATPVTAYTCSGQTYHPVYMLTIFIYAK